MLIEDMDRLTLEEDFVFNAAEINRRMSHWLFPNSPIEVIADKTEHHYSVFNSQGKREEKVDTKYHFSVYVEGEWDAKETCVADAMTRVREVVKINRELWDCEILHTCPDWPGWREVNMGALLELIGAA